MLKRGLCFDLDGTLIDSGLGGLEQLQKVAKSLNLPMDEKTEAKLKAMWGQPTSNLIKAVWPQTDIDQFYRQWNLDFAELWPVFPGTKETIKKLFEYFHLSILTNRDTGTTIIHLKHNGILHYFGLVVAADTSPYKKPHLKSIDPILNLYGKVGIGPGQMIFVGDTVEYDWKLAEAVGIEFFAVLSGGMDNREKFLAAGVPEDHIINSVADLPRILLK